MWDLRRLRNIHILRLMPTKPSRILRYIPNCWVGLDLLADVSGLSPSTVSRLVSDLLDEGSIRQEAPQGRVMRVKPYYPGWLLNTGLEPKIRFDVNLEIMDALAEKDADTRVVADVVHISCVQAWEDLASLQLRGYVEAIRMTRRPDVVWSITSRGRNVDRIEWIQRERKRYRC